MPEDLLTRLVRPLLSLTVGPQQAQLALSAFSLLVALVGWLAARHEWRESAAGRARQIQVISALLGAIGTPITAMNLTALISAAFAGLLVWLVVASAAPIRAVRGAARAADPS